MGSISIIVACNLCEDFYVIYGKDDAMSQIILLDVGKSF